MAEGHRRRTRTAALDQQDYRVQIAQFCCELAQDALLKKRPEDAVEWLRRHAENPANVRAPILLGDVAAAAGDTEGALKHWLGIEARMPPMCRSSPTRW
jgi:lipopolysaccharide biosynthesis regulator YciM